MKTYFIAPFSTITKKSTRMYWIYSRVKGEKKVYFTAPKSKDDEFTFVGMADHQTFADATERGFVKIASENPDFIVSAGDMLENGKLKNWQENFFQKMPILQGFPFAACEGNNDAGLNLFQSFLALDNRYYSFTYGNTRFVVLDSNLTFNEGSEQIEWLENTLKEIAQITGYNLNTVKSRLYAGLKKLKNIVGEDVQ